MCGMSRHLASWYDMVGGVSLVVLVYFICVLAFPLGMESSLNIDATFCLFLLHSSPLGLIRLALSFVAIVSACPHSAMIVCDVCSICLF